MEISLEMLLASRDARHRFEKELLETHPNLTLVVLTVVMPGKVKRNDDSLLVARNAMEALTEGFGQNIILSHEKDLPTGFEAYLLVSLTPAEAKRTCCEIEDRHPMGRLMDLDVIRPDGVPMSRTEIGREGRRCLVCGEHDARYCMRAGSHTQQELQQAIHSIIHGHGFR